MNVKAVAENQVARGIVVAVFIGTFLGISGAFGTGQLSIYMRIFYFTLVGLVGTILANSIAFILDKFIDDQDKPILYHSISLAILTLATTLFLFLLSHFLFKFSLNWENYTGFLIPVFAVSIFFTVFHALIERTPIQTHAVNENKNAPKLLSRLPIKYRNSVVFAVKSEDHYLKIYTSLGDELVLYRFSDALHDLEGIEGVQTHRSWWVSIDAIEKIEKDYGKNFYLLKNQLKVPISRTYFKALKALNLV